MNNLLFKTFFVAIASCSYACAMNMNHDPHVCVSGRFTEHGEGEFFTSFADPARTYYPTMFFGIKDLAMVDRVPYIGHYQNEGTKKSGKTHGDWYNPCVRLALIELAPKVWRFFVPKPLEVALKRAGISDLSAVEYFVNIVGNFDRLNEAPFGKDANSCNVVFHPIIRRWRGTQDANFNVPVQAGIFETSGVRAYSGGIALNSLARLDVNYHDRDNFSPDNGRFYYDPELGVATFWTVVVYDGHVNVTLNVIATNEETEKRLMRIMDVADVGRVITILRDTYAAIPVPGLNSAISILEGQSGIRRADPFGGREKTLAVKMAPSEKTCERELSQREIIARAAEKRRGASKPVRERRPVAGPSSSSGARSSSSAHASVIAKAPHPALSYIDELIEEFKASLEHANFESAFKLLTAIKSYDPVRAEHYEDLYNEALDVLTD